MSDIRIFTTDPGIQVLLGEGAVINVVVDEQPRVTFGPGSNTIGLVGRVRYDLGVNAPVVLEGNTNDLYSMYGGFDSRIGDGPTAGYNGNLVAQASGFYAPQVVLVPVNMELREAGGSPALLTVTNTSLVLEDVIIPAGTIFAELGGAKVMLPQAAIIPAGTAAFTATPMRVVFNEGTFIADLSTYTIVNPSPKGWIDYGFGVTAGGLAVEIDLAETRLRYIAAIDTIPSNQAGMAIDVLVADHTDATIQDYVSTFCAAQVQSGLLMMGAVAPPVGTSTADARGSTGDGIARAGLDRSRVSYTHMGRKKKYLLDARNISDPSAVVDIAGQIPWAFRIANEAPENNPARPHAVLRSGGIVGNEFISPLPDSVTHFKANIVLPELIRRQGGLDPTYRDGIMANGDKVADRRMTDAIILGLVENTAQMHKAPATSANIDRTQDLCVAYLATLKNGERIGDFSVAVDYNPAVEELVILAGVQLRGNIDILTIRLTIGTSVVIDA